MRESHLLVCQTVDEKTVDPEKLMSKISVVFQDVYLFQDTIGNNIRYGGKMPRRKKLKQPQN